MKKLSLTDSSSGAVTLHEACKSAYTGLDLHGLRDVLQQLPGVKLIEMEHSGSDSICCGSGAACWFIDSCAQIRDKRLQEAAETGEQMLALLGKLSKCAWDITSAFLKSAVPRDDAVPGASIAIQTYGDFLNFNPHLHAVVTHGCFLSDGSFVGAPSFHAEDLQEALQ